MAKTRRRTDRDQARGGDPILRMMQVARRQLEEEPGGPLGWAVRFAREEPQRWLPGDVEAHGYRLLALIYGPLPPNVLQLGEGDIPPITPGDVETLHAELSTFFRELVSVPAGRPVPVPTDDLREVIVRSTRPGEKPAGFHRTNLGGPRRTILFQAVKELLLAGGDRLIACPGPKCGKPFLALRKKLFCSPPCLQAWHDARRPKKKGGPR